MQRLVWNFEYATTQAISLNDLIKEQEELKWERRFFWSQDQIITLKCFDKELCDLGNYQKKHKEDYYFLLPDKNYNIKRRDEELFYKPLVKQTGSTFGFGTKIKLSQCDDAQLKELTQQTLKKGKELLVKKDAFIYKFPSTPMIKLELARINIKETIYFSACIEGKSQDLVEIISEHLFGKQISCDYMSFLKKIIKS